MEKPLPQPTEVISVASQTKEPSWTAQDVTLEDLAKLPPGPREVMLLNYSTHEIIRLSYIDNLEAPIKKVLESPGFWLKVLARDGFLLPENILDFANQWHKKGKTAAQFLRSLYSGFDVSHFDQSHLINSLKKQIKYYQKYAYFDDMVSKMQELLAEYKAKREALLPFEETLILLEFSSRIYQARKENSIKVYLHLNFVERISLEEISWTAFVKEVIEQPIRPDSLAEEIPDPLSLLDVEDPEFAERRKQQKSKEKKEKHEQRTKIEPSRPNGKKIAKIVYSRSKSPIHGEMIDEKSSFSIQQPEYAQIKQKLIYYLSLLRRAVREGDIIASNTEKYYLYFKDGELWLKLYRKCLPEEAIPKLKQHSISTARDLGELYNVRAIEIQGRVVPLSNQTHSYLRYGDHIFYVESKERPVVKTAKKPSDLRCRWLTQNKEGKVRRCGGKVRGLFFCDQHVKAQGIEEQVRRCEEEDEEDKKEEGLEMSLDDFKPLEKTKKKTVAKKRVTDPDLYEEEEDDE
jgi:hypothetical protein